MAGKKNDHRARVTKMLLRRSFTELLRHKPVQSISVKELCEAAGVNRGTFYTHYTDIYDLLAQIENDMAEDLSNSLSPLFTADDVDLSMFKVCSEVFACLAYNADLCAVTLGEYGDKSFVYRLIGIGREWYIKKYSECFPEVPADSLEYYFNFMCSGCLGMLRKWLNDGMIISSGELAHMAEKIMLSGIGFLST